MLILRNLLNELKIVNDSVRDDEGNGIYYKNNFLFLFLFFILYLV